MKYLVTGAAGFIGYFLSKRLLKEGNTVIAIDSLNDYYSSKLKEERLKTLKANRNFIFFKGLLEDISIVEHAFSSFMPDVVIHLAAQAGVRYSIENPQSYVDSNLVGFLSILEMCRKYGMEHFLFASSSSVYGLSSNTPYREEIQTDCPVSL